MSLIYFFIGIGLSMDAFSVSLSLGTTNPRKRNVIITSITIGIFHFFMPIFGYTIGTIFNKINHINILTSSIFIMLAYEIYRNRNEENKSILNIINIFLIAISVSFDSLTVGIALGLNNEIIYIASIIFSIVSFTFTYIGFILGEKLKENYKNKSTYIGIILLLVVALKYLLNV